MQRRLKNNEITIHSIVNHDSFATVGIFKFIHNNT